jgi:small subunit ribosomal protein S9
MATAIKKEDKWIEAIGRRKTAIARVRITPSARTNVTINKKDVNAYFPTQALQLAALEPFLKIGLPTQFVVTVVVKGGGSAGQAIAVRHGISRALTEYDHTLRGALKKEGYLKRDPRAVERKKPGLRKARKRKQWSKR